jgi:hypothetical protein
MNNSHVAAMYADFIRSVPPAAQDPRSAAARGAAGRVAEVATLRAIIRRHDAAGSNAAVLALLDGDVGIAGLTASFGNSDERAGFVLLPGK